MTRDFSNINRYLDELVVDIYPQPEDENHSIWMERFIDELPLDYETVLDIGCGQGYSSYLFGLKSKKWVGVTLGEDYKVCKNRNLEVYCLDFSFLNRFDDGFFDLLFCRHVLEHSPMPLLTLMEWRRVSKRYLAVVLPSPKEFKYFGRNHYSVMNNTQFLWLAARAGWHAILKDYTEPMELRYVLEKAEPRIEYPHESETDFINEYGEV